jgi:hypothetical protein
VRTASVAYAPGVIGEVSRSSLIVAAEAVWAVVANSFVRLELVVESMSFWMN